jgi:hypothetical protein
LKPIKGRRCTLAVLCVAAPLSSSALAETPVAAAAFECQGGKSIDATFYANSVDVGRALRQQGREFVFWNKGDTAFVTEGKDGKETYSGCGRRQMTGLASQF